MKLYVFLMGCLCALVSFSNFAEQTTTETAYIADDLFIYMHSGPGKQYRIVGTIIAGSQIQLTGEKQNGFTEFVNNKGKNAWVEDGFIQQTPGLRHVVAQLNTELAESATQLTNIQTQLDDSQQQVEQLIAENASLKKRVELQDQQLTELQKAVSTKDFDIQKQWFLNGAMVLGIGLLFGLIIPRIPMRRKRSLDSWH